MDALADTRTINLQLNLQHPDSSGYNLVRVREIAIDSSAIPLSGQLRKPMDTTLGTKSILALTLPPGRRSLLEMTFAESGQDVTPQYGDLRFNNQRKFLFDGRRWHAVYQRRPQARIDAQPNPFTGTTELRFSIPTPGYATVRVFDPVGRMIAEVLPQQWMEVGRYAVEFDASQLQPGTYLVELMLGQQRVVEKMVVVR